jgi:hypothetical protein
MAALSAAPANGAATRAEYVSQVNGICVAANNQAAQDLKKVGKLPTKPKALGRLLERGRRLFAAHVARLAAVTAAPGDEAIVATWVDSLWQMKRTYDRFTRVFKRVLPAFLDFEELLGEEADKKDLQKLLRAAKKLKRVSDAFLRANNYSANIALQIGVTECLEVIDPDAFAGPRPAR